MKEDDLDNFKPIFMIGYAEDKFICGINPTDDGINVSQVVGACIAIIDGFITLLPEEDQNEAEDAIFETIQDLKENRHEYLEKVKFNDKKEEE